MAWPNETCPARMSTITPHTARPLASDSSTGVFSQGTANASASSAATRTATSTAQPALPHQILRAAAVENSPSGRTSSTPTMIR